MKFRIDGEKELLERLGTKFCDECDEISYEWDLCRKHYDLHYPDCICPSFGGAVEPDCRMHK